MPPLCYPSSIVGMKVSVSLSADDLAAIDEYARANGLTSRSAVVQHAVRRLRHPDLEQDYGQAFAEWEDSGEAETWEAAAGDGVARAAG